MNTRLSQTFTFKKEEEKNNSLDNLMNQTNQSRKSAMTKEVVLINKEAESTAFTEILGKLEKDQRFALFHPGISRYNTIVNELNNKQYFSTKPSDPTETNYIILETNQKIYPTREGWAWLLKHRLFTKEELERLQAQKIAENSSMNDSENKQKNGDEIKQTQETKIVKQKESNNYLFDRLQNAQKECIKNMKDNEEEEKLIKELMKDENFVTFLYDFISQNLLASRNSNYMLGVTKFCIDLGDKICKYLLIIKKPALYNMLMDLDEEGDKIFQNQNQFVTLIKFMAMVFNAKTVTDKSIKPLFKEMKIENKKIQNALFYYLKQRLYMVNEYVIKYPDKLPALSVLGPHLVESISSMQKYNEIVYLTLKNDYKKLIASIGDIFTENVFITHNILIREKEEEGGPKKRFKNAIINELKDTDRWTFRPETAILKQILIDYKPDLPVLDTKHLQNLKDIRGEIKYKLLHQKEDYFIHSNEHILMHTRADCYLSQEKSDNMLVKYSVDLDYLKEFLLLLMKTKANTNDHSLYNAPFPLLPDDRMFVKSYIEMHNINLNIIEQLINKYEKILINDAIVFHENNENSSDATFTNYIKDARIYGQLTNIINYLCSEIMDFETYRTKAQILKDLQPNNINWKEIPHKDLLEEFIDKLCQRKLFIIRLINDCIEHAIYDHFGVKHFLDSRGRAYLSMIYMNINTNHPAKLFIKLYDVNKGATFDEGVKETIAQCLLFSNPKKNLRNLNPEYINKQNERMVEEYILSLCDKMCSKEDVQDFLNNSKYDASGSMMLLHDIKPKKEKERFFIHSLIRSERIIRYSKNIFKPKHFVNYMEKDARSSGLQMISILFRSPSLAKWANLLHGETVDIYSVITKACKERKEELLFIAQYTFKIFSCEDFLHDSKSLMPLQLKKMPSILEEWANKKIPSILLHTWINLDIKSLPKNDKYVDLFLEEFTQYYSSHSFDLFHKYNEEQQKQFIKCIPHYDKIMQRLATASKKYIDLQTYQILVIIQYALRLTIIIKQKYSFLETSPIWDSRNLYKQAIMTRFYNSTRFGRRKDFIESISEKHILPQGYTQSANFIEFLEFLDDFFIQYLNTIEDSTLLDKLSEDLSKQKRVKIANTFFDIQIAPKKMEMYRLSTGSKKYSVLTNIDKPHKNPQISLKLYKVTQKVTPVIKDKKNSQIDKLNSNLDQYQEFLDENNKELVVINATNETSNTIISDKKERKIYAKRRSVIDPDKLVDHKKLKAMIGPNIIHSMDSSIVHIFRILVNQINEKFKKSNTKDKTRPVFQLALEMNHDCYILSFPVLLPILLEECYLSLSDTNYLSKIEGVKVSKYQRMTTKDFEKLLTPINPDFIK